MLLPVKIGITDDKNHLKSLLGVWTNQLYKHKTSWASAAYSWFLFGFQLDVPGRLATSRTWNQTKDFFERLRSCIIGVVLIFQSLIANRDGQWNTFPLMLHHGCFLLMHVNKFNSHYGSVNYRNLQKWTYQCLLRRLLLNWMSWKHGYAVITTTTTNFIEKIGKITNYITFPPANSL